MGLRSYKRDGRGRFATTNSSSGKKSPAKKRNNSLKNARAIAKNASRVKESPNGRISSSQLSKQERIRRNKRLKRNLYLASSVALTAGAAAIAYQENSYRNTGTTARMAHARATGQRVNRANTRGLGSMIIARQSRSGVYRITGLR